MNADKRGLKRWFITKEITELSATLHGIIFTNDGGDQTAMLMTIRYKSGLRVEAVVLAANRERMRVAIDSETDTFELQIGDACWHTEDGAEIEIEALIPIAEPAFSALCARVYPLTNCAAHRCMFA